MTGRWLLLIVLTLVPGASLAADCDMRKVDTGLLNISKEVGGTTYVDVMVGGDRACVTEKNEFEGSSWGYVAHKLDDSEQEVAVEGWAPMRYLSSLDGTADAHNDGDSAPGECRRYLPMLDQTVSCEGTKTAANNGGSPSSSEGGSKKENDKAATREPEPERKPEPKRVAETAPKSDARPARRSEPTRTANNDSDGDELRYTQPVPFGPYPVNGLSIQQLVETVPLFAPLEGLPEDLWKKSCSTCHKWNQERLCEQGKTYAKDARNVLRHQHPMGGAFKIALMKWSKSGCK
ncbi:MAG: hypothetical protein KJ622_12270 [Alphaproteobacteria bacterium]|nr:hypothetical protein [Alphaproteobacteria bacterium]